MIDESYRRMLEVARELGVEPASPDEWEDVQRDLFFRVQDGDYGNWGFLLARVMGREDGEA